MPSPDSATKVVPLSELETLCGSLRDQGKHIVHCHGVFDLLHIGHIKHFEAARKLGDVLIVTLTPDRFVQKGPGRPAFTEQLRAEAIAALAVVNFVAINSGASATTALAITKPHRYAKGSDYRNRASTTGSKLQAEIDLVESFGGAVAFTEEPQYSSSALFNQFLSPYPLAVREELQELKARFTSKDIQSFCVALDTVCGEMEVGEEYRETFSGLFPKVTFKGVVGPLSSETTPALTISLSGWLTFSLKTGITEIGCDSLVSKRTGSESQSIACLSSSQTPLTVVISAARTVALLEPQPAGLVSLFLAVLCQEWRAGIRLSDIRKVMESLIK